MPLVQAFGLLDRNIKTPATARAGVVISLGVVVLAAIWTDLHPLDRWVEPQPLDATHRRIVADLQ